MKNGAMGAELPSDYFCSCSVLFSIDHVTADSLEVYQLCLTGLWQLWAGASCEFAKLALMFAVKRQGLEQLARLILFELIMFFSEFVFRYNLDVMSTNESQRQVVKQYFGREDLSYVKLLTICWCPFIRFYCLCCFWSAGFKTRSGVSTVFYFLLVS